MTWEPTEEEVRAFAPIISERPMTKAGRKKWYREALLAAWAVSPGPRRTEALRECIRASREARDGHAEWNDVRALADGHAEIEELAEAALAGGAAPGPDGQPEACEVCETTTLSLNGWGLCGHCQMAEDEQDMEDRDRE